MRLVVGVDEDGHQYAVRVDTFKRLKAYVLDSVISTSWKYNRGIKLREQVDVHDTDESLLADDQLVDRLYVADILNGRTSRYKEYKGGAKEYVLSHLKRWIQPTEELIHKIEQCRTEEELLGDEIDDALVDRNVFWGRDRFTNLSDYCPEEDDEGNSE